MARPAPEKRRSSLTPFYAVLALVAVAGVIWLVVQSQQAEPATEMVAVNMTPQELQRVPGISQGDPNAPVVVMEFADFQCPACGQFHTFSKPLLQPWIESGAVRFVYYDFPLTQIHQNAVLASRAGRCANEQGKFWEYADFLYGQQSAWSNAADAADLFVQYAARVPGLDADAFEACLRSDRYTREVSESYKLGESFGVGGTPTVIVNGKIVPSIPRTSAEWEQLIQAETGGAAASPAAGVGAEVQS